MANGHDIIIKGGSVDVDYDDAVYPRQGNSSSHRSENNKITRITVVDDLGNTVYDSGEENNGLKWVVRAYCR